MTTQKQDLVTVIATRAKAIDFWSFMHYLPNPDPVLKKMGKDISAYRESYPTATWWLCAPQKSSNQGA